jgi:hypothetical protein
MRPPNAVNHLTLAMASYKNTNPAGEKLLAGKDRPDWVDGLKNVMWAREKDFRFAFEVNGKKYARCWMCLSTDEALKCEIDHVYAWSKILAKLKSDADDPVERQKYPDKGKDMFAAFGPWSITRTTPTTSCLSTAAVATSRRTTRNPRKPRLRTCTRLTAISPPRSMDMAIY